VFEVRGPINTFADAVRRVPGLELIDEQELEADGEDSPVAYLLVPDIRALQDLEGLWRRWLAGQLERGETPWRDVFALLRDLRPWGPQDRVQTADTGFLEQEIEGRADNELVRLEVELVFRARVAAGAEAEAVTRRAIQELGGRTISTVRIEDIAYHAALADLPVPAVRRIVGRAADSIAGLETVLHIRPQSVASGIEITEAEPGDDASVHPALGYPILALLDGVPVPAHRLLADHVIVDDRFGLEPTAPVAERVHGTAMASLIIHGDRNGAEQCLPRQIHVVPVLGSRDAFPSDRLIIDIIYTAVVAMREGSNATAPHVVVVNLSLGNARRPFHGQLSAWARLLDYLAGRYGILFIVSAGNCLDAFAIRGYADRIQFEDADPAHRAQETLRAVGAVMADRRLFSPAETVNGVTVGACNEDLVSSADRATARVNVDPYGGQRMANPSSALGPGFALAVKPDVLMPGARERLRVLRNHEHIEVGPAGPARAAGLRVAAPPRGALENADGFTSGTSAATALASRTCHRIHDALELAYGDAFLALPPIQRAVLLKALLVHTAKWPTNTATFIRQVIGPPEGKFHSRQKDNIRRFLGFGMVATEDAVACAEDRATFWATGFLGPDKTSTVNVPVPAAIGGQARPHSLSVTLAWFTPIASGRKSYRTVRLKVLEPDSLGAFSVKAHGDQPDANQTNRGTLFMRCWSGNRAPVVGPNMVIPIAVQRDPDQGASIDDAVPFGLAITLAMPGVVQLYDQVVQRLNLGVRARV